MKEYTQKETEKLCYLTSKVCRAVMKRRFEEPSLSQPTLDEIRNIYRNTDRDCLEKFANEYIRILEMNLNDQQTIEKIKEAKDSIQGKKK